jgi:minor extracellular serine protease Vpr
MYFNMNKLISLLAVSAFLSLSATAQTARQYSPKLTASTVSAALDETKRNVNAFITLKENADSAKLTEQYGVRLNVKVGNCYTALVPLQMIDSLALNADVIRIDVGETARTMLDSVRIMSHIDEIHEGIGGLNTSYKGKDVIVGIIDTGFDYRHPTFSDADGNSRIACVWDQNGTASTGNSYGYGTVLYSQEDISSAVHDHSFDTHGTHVAGIAAGSAEGTLCGVAPESDIAFVSTNKTEQGIVDGVDFLIKYAEARHKPLAINISFGVVLGYKDGSGTLASMIDGLLADRKGVLLAIATGNEGHRAATLTAESNVKSIWNIPTYGRDNLFVLGEKDESYTLQLTLRDTKTDKELFTQTFSAETEWTKSYTDFGTEDSEHAQLTASSMVNPLTGRRALSLNLLYRCAEGEQWELEMTPEKGHLMANCDYGTFTSGGNEGFTAGVRESSIASTATGNMPIAVGAYVSRRYYTDITGKERDMLWERNALYPMSGQGPTFDGRIKPDVAAPGAAVISALNSYAAPYSVPNSIKTGSTTADGRNYFWGAAYGTSMATPVVTGTLALWLQVKGDMTAEEAKQLIRSTSAEDSFTGLLPNNAYGYGKLNALAGLKKLLETDGINYISDDFSSPEYIYDADLNTVIAAGADSIQLFSSSGMLIKQTKENRLNVGGIGSGVYIVRINGKAAKCFKISL